MKCRILHETKGRLRVHLCIGRMTLRQADLLEAWLKGQPWARDAVVHERTCCVIVYYDGDRRAVLEAIRRFSWQEAEQTL